MTIRLYGETRVTQEIPDRCLHTDDSEFWSPQSLLEREERMRPVERICLRYRSPFGILFDNPDDGTGRRRGRQSSSACLDAATRACCTVGGTVSWCDISIV